MYWTQLLFQIEQILDTRSSFLLLYLSADHRKNKLYFHFWKSKVSKFKINNLELFLLYFDSNIPIHCNIQKLPTCFEIIQQSLDIILHSLGRWSKYGIGEVGSNYRCLFDAHGRCERTIAAFSMTDMDQPK